MKVDYWDCLWGTNLAEMLDQLMVESMVAMMVEESAVPLDRMKVASLAVLMAVSMVYEMVA